MAIRLTHFRSTAAPRWLSTATATATALTQDKPKTILLYNKLMQLKSKPDSEADISAVLDEWAIKNRTKRFDIVDQINIFRSRKNFRVALQLSEWLESRKIKMNNADRAIRIDLLAKTKGITSAEIYFDSLEGSAKTNKTYGALLNCYCKEKMLDKALEVFAKMKELGFTSTLNYNNVISLYLSTDKPEQVPLLVQELEQKNLKPDIYTYNLLINSYASVKDIDAVEKVIEKMKTDEIKFDWFTYGNQATIYVNAGLLPKAKGVIKKMEDFKFLHDRELFHTLINLYRQISDLSGVHRAWISLKSVFPSPSNTSYLIMLLALSQLGDLESLEKCFREWESGCSLFDVRLYNVILETYFHRNMIEEANTLYESMVTKGIEPNLRTLELLTSYHIKNDRIDLALKYLEMGVCKATPEGESLFPTDETIKMFLKYFVEKNDTNRAEKFCNSMKKIDRLDSTVYDSLLSRSC